jgi:hypothetical protein
VSESPIWANSSYAAPTILPGTGTGAPIAVGTASYIAPSESPIYANTTTTVTVTPSAVEAPVFVTQVPVTVTGVPGSIVNLSVSLPNAPFPNNTASAYIAPASETAYFNTTTTVGETATAAPISVSGVPVASYSDPALYPNTTTAIVTEVEVSTATAILILPSATDAAVEFPGTFNETAVRDY